MAKSWFAEFILAMCKASGENLTGIYKAAECIRDSYTARPQNV